MIRRETINGRVATVGYFTKDLKPTDPETAEIIKIHFDDGETMFAYPADAESNDE